MDYKKCILQKGSFKVACWLPEEFAKEGKFLILEYDGKKEEQWYITTVFDSLAIDSFANIYHDNNRYQREVSDI